jgi:tRNA(Arg) A34 adenosine deaminase TadA
MPLTPNPEHLRRAIALATENVQSGTGGPFAALIVRPGPNGDEVIAEAANSVTTTNDPTAHGEVNAIRKACAALGTFSLAGCVIYTSCEPCPMCLAAIYWARLEAIYFGCNQHDAARADFDDAFLYEQLRLSGPDRSIPSEQLLQEEAWGAFAAWQALATKVDY